MATVTIVKCFYSWLKKTDVGRTVGRTMFTVSTPWLGW